MASTDGDRLSIVRDEKGDHAARMFADIYLGTTPIGGLFCSPEHFSAVEKMLSLYNATLTKKE